MAQCRICLIKNQEYISLKEVKYEGKNLVEIIYFCTQIEISFNENFPQFICIPCFEELKIAFHLKNKCIDSDVKLKNSIIKQEQDQENINAFFVPEASFETSNENIKFCENSNAIIQQTQKEIKTCLSPKKKSKIKRGRSLSKNDCISSIEFACSICKKTLKTKSTLYYHIKEHKSNGDDPLDECGICKKKFYFPDSYLKHKCPIKPICYLCNIEFNLRTEVYQHIEKVHFENGSFTCEQPGCKSVFTSTHGIFFHNISHFNPIIEICSLCGKIFKDPRAFSKHGRFHKQRIQFTCDLCGIQIWRKSNLFRHMKTCHLNKKYYCDQCDANFTETMSLKLHKIKLHNLRPPFRCETCNIGFVYQSQLKIHEKGHMIGKHFRIKDQNEISVEGKRAWECRKCSKTFNMKANYKRHLKTVHMHIRQFSCNTCSKSFTQKAVLETHLRIHTGEKPFGCNQCPAKYSDRSTLYKHLKNIHKEEKPATKVSLSLRQQKL